MENEKKESKELFAVYSYSDEEFDAGVRINVSSSSDLATLTTAFAQLVIESDTFAEIWHMVNASVYKLREDYNNENKVYN